MSAPPDLTPMQICALELLQRTAHTEMRYEELRLAMKNHGHNLPKPRFTRLIQTLADARLLREGYVESPRVAWKLVPLYSITPRGTESLAALRKNSTKN